MAVDTVTEGGSENIMDEKQYPGSGSACPAGQAENASVFPSEFCGRTIQLIGWQLLGVLLGVITLGIGAPWAHCMVIRWETRHTYIGGKQLCFDGKGHQLLGRYLLWGLLTLVTLGIYALFIPVRMHKWRASHTRFAKPGEVQKGPSGGLIFGVIMAAVAVVAVVALVVVLLTKETEASRPSHSDPGGLEEFYFGSLGDGYQFHIGEDGQYVVVFPNGQGTVVISPDDIESILITPGGQEIILPSAGADRPPVQNTEQQPQRGSGSLVGGWLTVSSHISGSSDVTAYRFESDGTFTREGGLYDFHEGWSYFLNGHTAAGWYTYEDGLLTLHSTRSMEWGGSDGGKWKDHQQEHVETYRLSFSEDGQILCFTGKDSATGEYTKDLESYYPMTGGITETLEHYYPNGLQ